MTLGLLEFGECTMPPEASWRARHRAADLRHCPARSEMGSARNLLQEATR